MLCMSQVAPKVWFYWTAFLCDPTRPTSLEPSCCDVITWQPPRLPRRSAFFSKQRWIAPPRHDIIWTWSAPAGSVSVMSYPVLQWPEAVDAVVVVSDIRQSSPAVCAQRGAQPRLSCSEKRMNEKTFNYKIQKKKLVELNTTYIYIK